MQKFHHSISVTQFPSLITQFFTPVWHHHPISITQYFSHYLWIPYLSLGQSTYVLLPAEHFHPISLLFSHFPFPFQPCHSPKAETQTHKNFSSPLASSGPSPMNNTQLSDVYGGAISSVVTHFPAAPTSIKKCDPFPHFVTDDLLRPKTVLLHPLNVLSHLDYLSDLCDLHLGFEKMNGFSLNSVCLCFSPLFGW